MKRIFSCFFILAMVVTLTSCDIGNFLDIEEYPNISDNIDLENSQYSDKQVIEDVLDKFEDDYDHKDKEDIKEDHKEDNNKDGNKNEDVVDDSISNLPESSEGLKFELSNDGKGYTLRGMGTCTAADIVVGTYMGLPVTEIGYEALKDQTDIRSVTISGCVTRIDKGAFYECTGLANVTICNGVTSIGGEAFFGCTSLVDITIPGSVTIIEFQAFKDAGLVSLTIDNSETEIENGAFSGCTGLARITIPDSVTGIGRGAFDNTAYYHNESNWDNGELYIGNHFIKADSAITGELTIREGTKTIAGEAFANCDNLTYIIVPDSVTSIGHKTFSGCTSLIRATLGDNVKMIGQEAFANCHELTLIDFQGVKSKWENITKYYMWNYNTGDYTVKCTDGDIAKADDN